MTKNNCYVYAHRRKDTGRIFYIGIGNQPLYARAFTNDRRSDAWKAIAFKHGYSVDVLNDRLSKDKAIEEEIFWINFCGRRDLAKGELVNHTNGGDGGFGQKLTEKKKLSILERNLGNKFNLGKKLSEETKEKIRAAHLGKTLSDEHRKKLSESHKGKKQSEEQCKKKSEALKGYKHSDQFRKNVSEAIKKWHKDRKLRKKIALENINLELDDEII
jgi:hypothetical protein